MVTWKTPNDTFRWNCVDNANHLFFQNDHEEENLAVVSNNTFFRSTFTLDPDSGMKPAEFHGNNFLQTSDQALILEDNHAYLTENWWGTTNTSQIDEMIYDYNDDGPAGDAFYLPILTSQRISHARARVLSCPGSIREKSQFPIRCMARQSPQENLTHVQFWTTDH